MSCLFPLPGMLSPHLWVPRKQAFTSSWAALGPTQYAMSVSIYMQGILDTKGMIAQIFRQRPPTTTPSCFRLQFHDATGREEAVRSVRETVPWGNQPSRFSFLRCAQFWWQTKASSLEVRQLDGKSLMRTAHLSPLHPQLTSLWGLERSVCP